jgi:hypothetical protein
MHWPDPSVPIEETAGFLSELVEAGGSARPAARAAGPALALPVAAARATAGRPTQDTGTRPGAPGLRADRRPASWRSQLCRR